MEAKIMLMFLCSSHASQPFRTASNSFNFSPTNIRAVLAAAFVAFPFGI